MFVYIVLFVYILFLIVKYDLSGHNPLNSKGANKHFMILEALFVLVAGLSYRIGIDSAGYMDAFPQYPTFSDFSLSDLSNYRHEPLWVLLNVFDRSTFDDFVFINLFCSISINIVLFKLFKQECKYPFTAILLYFLLGWINVSFEMLRQTCATAFYLWGCLALLKGNRKSFLLRSIPAVFFHLSGIFLILITLLFSFIKSNRSVIIISVVVFFIGLALRNYLRDFVVTVNMFSGDLGDKYVAYMDKTLDTRNNFFGMLEIFVLNVVLPVSVIMYYQRIGANRFFTSLLLAYLFFASLIPAFGIFYRLANSVQFFYYIGFANMLHGLVKSKRSNAVLIAASVLMLYNINLSFGSLVMGRYYSFEYNGKDIRYFPYSSVITKETIPQREARYDNDKTIYKW